MQQNLYSLYRDLQNSKSKEEKASKLEKLLFVLRNSLVGREVVVYTKDGYHYGTLINIDDEYVYLSGYYFNKELIDVFEYAINSSMSEAIVPREKVISIAEIPLHIRETSNRLDKKCSKTIDEYHI